MIRPVVFFSALALLVAGGCRSNSNGSQATVLESDKTVTSEDTSTTGEAPEATATATATISTPMVEGFAANAFPPTLPDTPWHRAGWDKNDCLRCHETGVQLAPRVVHRGMPPILMEAKCRTCHVLIPGQKARGAKALLARDQGFAPNAFPPMIPNSGSHQETWTKDDCMLCHETGIRDAPLVRHEGMPRILLQSKCRTCHVQVRAVHTVWAK